MLENSRGYNSTCIYFYMFLALGLGWFSLASGGLSDDITLFTTGRMKIFFRGGD